MAIFALCLLVAIFRHALGANARAGFWPVFGTLPIVLARLAQQSPVSSALWLAVGVLIAGALWHLGALLLNRRTPDAIFLALLAFQFFFLARFCGSLLPFAAPLVLSGLVLAQKINGVLQVVLLVVLAAWSTRPAASPGYENSAPSRVTRFLKKRRMPSRIAGVLIMALTIIATLASSRLVFGEANIFTNIFPALQPPIIFGVWLALDGFYFLGRALWQRVH